MLDFREAQWSSERDSDAQSRDCGFDPAYDNRAFSKPIYCLIIWNSCNAPSWSTGCSRGLVPRYYYRLLCIELYDAICKLQRYIHVNADINNNNNNNSDNLFRSMMTGDQSSRPRYNDNNIRGTGTTVQPYKARSNKKFQIIRQWRVNRLAEG